MVQVERLGQLLLGDTFRHVKQVFSGGGGLLLSANPLLVAAANNEILKRMTPADDSLIKDLKQRGLLEDTLVVWMGDFGRTPDNGIRGGIKYGRDHNPDAMTVWLAGGGVKAGHTIGATNEIGAKAVEIVHPLRDFHVTLLRLMGLDDNNLTYFHAGRYKQLSQFGGEVIEELIG